MRRMIALLGLTAGLAVAPFAAAQPPGPKLTWVYAHDVKVRPAGVDDLKQVNQRIGIEFFEDPKSQALVAVSQSGMLAVAPLGPLAKDRGFGTVYGLDFPVRKADEEAFTGTTAKLGVEAIKDGASGKLAYVTEKGAIALAEYPAAVVTDKPRKWHHGQVYRVRKPDEAEFGKDTRKVGVEVYKDENSGYLVYLTETGGVAVAPAPARPPAPDAVKKPKPLYGLSLPVRAAADTAVTKDTKKVGVEVYKDENTGGLVYVTEAGGIACVPVPATVKTSQGVAWAAAYRLQLRARPGGVADSSQAKAFGVEVLTDNNTGYTVYVSDAGGIAVLARK
ncbi:MAG: hypothetical protein U0871_14455 [Gemmataceae bacterium]